MMAAEFYRALIAVIPDCLSDEDSPILVAMTQHRQYEIVGVHSNEDGDVVIDLEFLT